MERKWWTLIAVCVATFMLLLDITVVNVALPDIQKDLNASLSSLQWVVDAYALTLAAFLLTAGSFADRIGRRRVFTVGSAIYTLASFLCGISNSATLLNLARGLQGVGGAAMFATSLALIAQEFQGRERGTAIGAWGATIGGAVAVGPLVGGALTEGLGWEWIFVVNVHRSDHAMLDLSLFRKPAFAGVSIVAMALSAGMFAMFLYITLYMQDVLGYSPLETGLRFLPLTLVSFFVAPVAGRLSAR